jgi:hypothetical protein
MEPDLLTRIRAEILERIAELEPLAREARALEAALARLEGQTAGEAPAASPERVAL